MNQKQTKEQIQKKVEEYSKTITHVFLATAPANLLLFFLYLYIGGDTVFLKEKETLDKYLLPMAVIYTSNLYKFFGKSVFVFFDKKNSNVKFVAKLFLFSTISISLITIITATMSRAALLSFSIKEGFFNNLVFGSSVLFIAISVFLFDIYLENYTVYTKLEEEQSNDDEKKEPPIINKTEPPEPSTKSE